MVVAKVKFSFVACFNTEPGVNVDSCPLLFLVSQSIPLPWLLPLAYKHTPCPSSSPYPSLERLPISLLNSTEVSKSSPTCCLYPLVNPRHLPPAPLTLCSLVFSTHPPLDFWAASHTGSSSPPPAPRCDFPHTPLMSSL